MSRNCVKSDVCRQAQLFEISDLLEESMCSDHWVDV